MHPSHLSDRAYVNRASDPIDPHNPFSNPTEESEYTPDYSEIVPQITIPGCRIPLIPSSGEKDKIRYFYTVSGCLALFDFLLAALLSALLMCAAGFALRSVDSALLSSELPQNYKNIRAAYLDDSCIAIGISLLSFLAANLITFFVGSRITHIRIKDYFQDQSLRTGTMMRYIAMGLWIQLVAGFLTHLLIRILENNGLSIYTPDFSSGNSITKLLLTVLYTAFIAPLTEELVFRGVILKNLSRVSQRFGIFFSAFFFAIAHENLPQGILSFFLGIFLAYITISHNSLVPAMIVHFSVNMVTMLSGTLQQIFPASAVSVSSIYMLAVLLFGSAAFFYTFLSERLPVETPHQSFRGIRIALTAPGIWLLVLAHIFFILLPHFSDAIEHLFMKG